jgi:TM2 domain-containing membrane protein YozV
MNNRTLATINALCIAFPMILGAGEELTGKPMTNPLLIGVVGLFMIIFGLWVSVRLYKIED